MRYYYYYFQILFLFHLVSLFFSLLLNYLELQLVFIILEFDCRKFKLIFRVNDVAKDKLRKWKNKKTRIRKKSKEELSQCLKTMSI